MNNKTKSSIFALLAILFWALAFPATKIAMKSFSTNSLAFLRCTIAFFVLIFISIINKEHLPKIKDIWLFALAGLSGFALYVPFFNTGLKSLMTGTSSIIIATAPIMTAVLSVYIYKEKIKSISYLFISTAFIGVVIIMSWNKGFSLNIGALWTFAAAVLFCIYNIINRKLVLLGYKAIQIATFNLMFGSFFLILYFPLAIDELSCARIDSLIALLFLSFIPSATAYIFWARAVSMAKKTTDITNYLFLTPLVTTILGYIILGESLSFSSFIGGLIIIISIYLFNLYQNKV